MAETKTARGRRADGARTARGEKGRRAPREDARAAGDGSATTSVCPVAFCPICTAVSAASRASPDVVQHLLLAGQQFLLALRAVVDVRAADFDDGQESPGSMERIEIG